MGTRKIRYMLVSRTVFEGLFSNRHEIERDVEVHLPDDVQILDIEFDRINDVFKVFLSSEKFEPLTDGSKIPQIYINITQYFPNKEVVNGK